MRFRFTMNSIAFRLIVFGTAIILLSALAQIFVLTPYLRSDVTRLNSAQLMSIASYVAKDIDHDIIDRFELLQGMARSFPLHLLKDPDALGAWLGERQEMNSLFSRGFVVLDSTGMVAADYPFSAHRRGASWAGRDYFREARAGRAAIGRPWADRGGKVPLLPMAAPLRDRAGTVRAVLVGLSGIRSPNFMEALYTTRVGATGGLVVVSPGDKLIIAASDLNIALVPVPPEGMHRQHDRAMKGFRGTGIDVNAGGVEELAAIVSIPSSGWFVVARMPTSEVFAPVTALRQSVLKSMVVVAPVLLLVLALGVRYQLRPLAGTAEHAERMRLGEVPLAPLPVARDDEVGRLTAAFNRVLSQLLESRGEAEQQYRAAEAATRAKSDFVAHVSHEIRTPLSAIIGTTKLLLDRGPGPDQQQDLEVLEAASRSLLALINDALDLSKLEAGRIELHEEPVSVAATLQTAERILRPLAAARQLAFTAGIEGAPLPRIQADPLRLEQILFNLGGNAVKFTDSGAVSISAEATEETDTKATLLFTVRDTGIGMTPEKMERLFSPFAQLSEERFKREGGTGLGLAITKRLVEAMGGVIEVESAEGKGSLFRVAIPFAKAPAGEEQAGQALPDILNILAAEDNRFNRELIARCLRQHRVTFAGTGAEALDLLEKEPFDLVLMDVQMPELDGITATKRLRSRAEGSLNQGIPMIAMTAYTRKEDRDACREAGMDGYVTKPIDGEALRQELERIWTGRPALRPHDGGAAGDKGVFDPELLMRLTGQDRAIAAELVGAFLDDFEKCAYLETMKDAIERCDGPQLALAAHTLKSAVAYFSARGASLASGLEKQGRDPDFSGAAAAHGELSACMDQLLPRLREYLQELEKRGA